LRPDSIIEAGNWGRIIRSLYRVGQADHDYRLHREMVYEFGRRIFNPLAPSRLDCFFACPTLEAADQYKQSNGPANIILRVEPLDPDTSVFTTSWAMFGSVAGTDLLGVEARIADYWSGGATNNLEVLVDGPVRVVGVI
jgi:hypothetical protein